ncbi:MAG: carboxypeptidase regulatory-like domain-containing protein [Deltaproteobacteria bacterium]|nr:carboxypeptidase regulatory-like domain-containing protein [Deltaproteobacteria bacterium]
MCVYGACYDPASAALQKISLEVAAPASSRMPAQQFRDFVVSGQARSEVVLTHAIEVHCATQDHGGTPLPALLTAQTANEIPGRPLRVDERTDQNGQTVMALTAGRAYSLRVLPDDATAVPFQPDPIFANDDIAGPLNGQTLTAPGPDELMTISGRTVVSTQDPQGVANLRVQLLGLVGSPAELRVVSTTAISGETDGGFQLRLPQMVNSGLQLRVAPTQSNPYWPVVTKSGFNFSGDTDLGLVELGNVTTPIAVSGTVSGPQGPVDGATITFVGTVGAGSYSATAVSAANGGYRIELLPGSYRAVAVPPIAASAALTETPQAIVIDVDPIGTSSVDFAAARRAWLRGTVTSAGGAVVAAATVRATRVGNAAETPGPGNSVRTVFETTTDGAGGYALAVDPGQLEVTVIPAPLSVEPRRTDLLTMGLTDLAHDVRLYSAAPFGGRVVTDSGATPVSDTLVRAYLVLDGDRAVLVGEEVTEGDGTFNLVLPKF